jgi:uncharacterized protein HemY
MKTKIKRLTIINKIALLALLLILLTNPWSAGYIGYAIELLATYFVLHSVYGFVLGLTLAVGVIIYFMWNSREQVHIPNATSKRIV